jgi:hypothetical protein
MDVGCKDTKNIKNRQKKTAHAATSSITHKQLEFVDKQQFKTTKNVWNANKKKPN